MTRILDNRLDLLVFFCGYHGVGKTYTAKALAQTFGATIVDCGPVIRNAFSKSGFESFGKWANFMEHCEGERWDDVLLLEKARSSIGENRALFIVGNRDIKTILFLIENISHKAPALIFYLEKPIETIKGGYESRMGLSLTTDEFEKVLHSGPDQKLITIKDYVYQHPDSCKYIYEGTYGDRTVSLAKDFIKTFM